MIVIQGQARIILGDTEKILNPNESFLVDGRIPHSVWNTTEQTTIILGISVKTEERETT